MSMFAPAPMAIVKRTVYLRVNKGVSGPPTNPPIAYIPQQVATPNPELP